MNKLNEQHLQLDFVALGFSFFKTYSFFNFATTARRATSSLVIQLLPPPRYAAEGKRRDPRYAFKQPRRLPSPPVHPSAELPQETLSERFVQHERREVFFSSFFNLFFISDSFLCCSQRFHHDRHVALCVLKVGVGSGGACGEPSAWRRYKWRQKLRVLHTLPKKPQSQWWGRRTVNPRENYKIVWPWFNLD